MALGQLGWTPETFWNATPREFFNALEGNYEREQFNQRQEWERTRWAVWWTIRPHVSKEITKQEMIEFPWEIEEKPPVTIPTDEDMKRILERDKRVIDAGA